MDFTIRTHNKFSLLTDEYDSNRHGDVVTNSVIDGSTYGNVTLSIDKYNLNTDDNTHIGRSTRPTDIKSRKKIRRSKRKTKNVKNTSSFKVAFNNIRGCKSKKYDINHFVLV